MNADVKTSDREPVLLPEGAVRCGHHVIEPWPSLQVTPSRGFFRGDDLLRADAGLCRESFTRRIPSEILRRVRSFPEGHWRLLEFCAGNPARGLELLTYNPALAVLVAEHCNNPAAHLRRRDMAKLVTRPWRGLLADLGMPTRPRTIRILRKLPVTHCTPAIAGRLRRVLRTGGQNIAISGISRGTPQPGRRSWFRRESFDLG